jgi:hypothetical protein
MKCLPAAKRNLAGAIRLLDVAAIICVLGVLAFVVALGMRSAEEKALRAQCRNNLMHIGTALKQYSLANAGSLPDCSPANPEFAGGAWPWDISTNLVSELARLGAGRDSLYCPANPAMNTLEHWEFWRFTHTSIRVISYGMLFYGQGQEPRTYWRKNLLGDGVTPPAKTELGFDGTVSMDDDFIHIRGTWTDRSNHVRGSQPMGGNILFEDQHVDWRKFEQMQPRFSTFPPATWYF